MFRSQQGGAKTILLDSSLLGCAKRRAIPNPQMLAEFFAGDVDGGVAAAMGGQSMAEALGASLGQVGCRTLLLCAAAVLSDIFGLE